MDEYRLVVKLFNISYYEGGQTTAEALAAERTRLMTSEVGRRPHLFRVYAVLSDLVNRRTGIMRHLTIYAHSTE